MKLTPQQARTYFEARLSVQKFTQSGENSMVRCPFHDDTRASLGFNPEKHGVWKCLAGCGQGGPVEFEKRFSTCDDQTAASNIAAICGLADQRLFEQNPEAVYQYRDEDGKVLFEKLRFPGKRFTQRAFTPEGKPVFNLAGVRRVLYNLPELITANHVAICEGEKDANNVNALGLAGLGKNKTVATRFVGTTNFDGAGKWKPEYSPYFAGKHVVIFPDNDAPGHAHALHVASSIFPYAQDVRIVDFPGLPDKGDVSDFLQNHTAQELLKSITWTPIWKPAADSLLIQAPQFLTSVSTDIEWLVDGVIQRGANGFICSLPKVGKSWVAADLVFSLALGLPWLGFAVPRAIKAALITREDNPALTKWRMRRLLDGKGRSLADLQDRLYVNSREQSAEFRLDQGALLGPMIAELKSVQPEFLILDVFNILHSADENDNTEMRQVLEKVNNLQREVGCAIGVVHHFNKQGEGTLTQRLRGSGAIAGWAEWLIGIESVQGELHNRRMQFELKAAAPPDAIGYIVRSEETGNVTRIERVEWVPEKTTRRQRAAEILQ